MFFFVRGEGRKFLFPVLVRGGLGRGSGERGVWVENEKNKKRR